jgi:HD-GYP domain-containing protein (c-di-GMP phosphodiesterase class II)
VRLLAEALGQQGRLASGAVETIVTVAPLHDIGKVGIPDSILNKPGRLTEDEMAVMREHVRRGEAAIARAAAEEIPLEGRIMAVADVDDALRSRRVDKPAMGRDEAARIILEGAGRHFAPALVRLFAALKPAFDRIATTMADAAMQDEPAPAPPDAARRAAA